MELTVVCGADHLTYWRAFADTPEPATDERIRMLGFVADVRPLYVEANLVIVPTTVSAGTNVKVLEAMAMQRAVVSTTSGCAGLGLVDRESVWVADAPEDFAAGIAALIGDARAAHPHGARRVRSRHAEFRLERRSGKSSASYFGKGIVHASAKVWALSPPAPMPLSSSSNVCRGSWLPLRPTAGIPAHVSTALKGNTGFAGGESA